eukprot:1143564-Pelagomonas_calceolata.AAC.2
MKAERLEQIRGNTSMADFRSTSNQRKNTGPGQTAQFISPGDLLTYLGVEITMTLDWKPQPSFPALPMPVTPCSEKDLAGWDRLVLITIKE